MLYHRIRTRYAPSPTGFQHIGGIRTALYCYLFAQKHKGELVLRIEDTDQKRYVEGAEQYIIDACNWLGITFNESPFVGGQHAPYRQSERRERYQTYAQQLIDTGFAYYAFDTPEELDAVRKIAEDKGAAFLYNAQTRHQMRNSLSLAKEETQRLLNDGVDYTIRFKIPENRTVSFYDHIRGEVSFDSEQLDDKVLYKADGWPTYHLANVVDDYLMQITHVIRGEEWLSSTPLHVLLYEAFAWDNVMPQFAHLPLLLNPGGKGKLSKRQADKLGFPVFPLAWYNTETGENSNGFKEMGFFPDAFVNFLALLGWNPGTEQEIFSMDELIEAFDLDRVHKAGAKFDFEKAIWFNQQYLRQKCEDELVQLLKKDARANNFSEQKLRLLVKMYKERVSFLHEIWTHAVNIVGDIQQYDEKMIAKRWQKDFVPIFEKLAQLFNHLQEFSSGNIDTCLQNFIHDNELKTGNVLLPLRLMLTGESSGPHIPDIAAFLGKAEVVERMESAMRNWG
ncbi:MAG: glutamate--tRNA ligase [Chitinophagales bacterium]|nr:glutamate--tRNA ligase [Bacteroidota bacterium]MCB9042780.1 glutamate--tRNA ligase [Chitinophagales bacterium]